MTRARKVSFSLGWRLSEHFFGRKAEKVVHYIHGPDAMTSTGVYQEASIKTAGKF